ncbi:sulfotransferase [Ekhidna sp.]
MKPKLIYIVGYERSGSTLLHNILSESANCFGVGELRHFKKRLIDGRPCACGSEIHQCEFWGEKAITLEHEKVSDYTRDKWILLYPFLNFYYRVFRRKEIAFFDELYKYAFQKSAERIIIDSSKSLTHLFLLSKILKYDVKAVFIVRNPRGILYSIKKRLEKDHQKYKIKNLRILSLKIDLVNWISNKLTKRMVSMHTVKYEDLIEKRAQVLAQFDDKFNTQTSVLNNDDDHFSFSGTHSVDGGPTRHVKGLVKLKVDDEWKSAEFSVLSNSYTLKKFY